MAYIVKFGYAPGDWRVETGKVHATREAALIELKELHEKFGTPGARVPYYALRVHKLPEGQVPRRLIPAAAVVQPPILRKRNQVL